MKQPPSKRNVTLYPYGIDLLAGTHAAWQETAQMLREAVSVIEQTGHLHLLSKGTQLWWLLEHHRMAKKRKSR